jgi:hypothetical protein
MRRRTDSILADKHSKRVDNVKYISSVKQEINDAYEAHKAKKKSIYGVKGRRCRRGRIIMRRAEDSKS